MMEASQFLYSYERFMQLPVDRQLAELASFGIPAALHKESESPFVHCLLYQYHHFHVEVTYMNWLKVRNVVPMLVLAEYAELTGRYASYLAQTKQ